VIIAESVPLELLAGGGVTGMLIAIMYAFLKRTKEADDRVSQTSQDAVNAALEREKRAWEERDRVADERDQARVERDTARLETEKLWAMYREERQQWLDGRL
jgi:HD superfamily phosphodiesterase